MDSKMEMLRAWGCDVDAAMKRMLDDEAFYLKCLDEMTTDDNFDALKNALEAGDISAAFSAAHTLKGVLANLGLTPLCNQIGEIVEPLRAGNGENLADKLDGLLKMRGRLAEILK